MTPDDMIAVHQRFRTLLSKAAQTNAPDDIEAAAKSIEALTNVALHALPAIAECLSCFITIIETGGEAANDSGFIDRCVTAIETLDEIDPEEEDYFDADVPTSH